MLERPLLIPLLSLIAGIAAASHWRFILPSTTCIAAFCACLLSCTARSRFLFLACVSGFFFVWGNVGLKPFLSPVLPSGAIVDFAGNDVQVIDGIIDERPEWQESGGKIPLRVMRIVRRNHEIEVSGRLLLYVGEGRAHFHTGDLVRFASRIRRPRNFGIPGEFDYERYLALQGVYATAFVGEAADVLLIRCRVAFPLRHCIDRLAIDVGSRISEALPGDEGAVMRALLLGESGLIPDDTRKLYSRTGASHILAISGFHVGTVAMFVYFLLFSIGRCSQRLLLFVNLRKTVLVLLVPVVLFYLMLSGGASSTIRSAIMITAWITALLLDRESEPVNALLLAAFMILAWFPPALFDISFQLSFFAVWGILVLTPMFMRPLAGRLQGVAHNGIQFMMVSAAATVATLIPVACQFHRTTLTGLIANVAIIPLMGYGAVVLGFTALPFLYLSPFLGNVLLTVSGFFVYLSTQLLSVLDAIPQLPVWRTTDLDLPVAFCLLAALTLLRGRWRVVVCCGLIGVFFVARLATADLGGKELRVDFFSVGQGESTLISFPNGKLMLVDGGGNFREDGFDPGERLLAPALWSRGVDRLDYMVLTHPHPDHMKGLLFLAETLTIGEFWESGCHDDSSDYRRLKDILASKGVPVRQITAVSGPIAIGSVLIEPLWPEKPPSLAGSRNDDTLNETSLVFRLGFDGFSMLFTGDIGDETEQRLVADPSLLRCTVLKVAHHGSRWSSSEAFLDAASPACALIGAGYGNRFRLPAPTTLDRFRKRKITCFRTDLDGSITVTVRDGNWSVAAFLKTRHFH